MKKNNSGFRFLSSIFHRKTKNLRKTKNDFFFVFGAMPGFAAFLGNEILVFLKGFDCKC